MTLQIKNDESLPKLLSITNEEHHNLPGLSSSQVVEIAPPRTPAHFYAKFLSGSRPDSKPSKAQEFGTLVHTRVLEPMLFETTVGVMPDFGDMRSKTNREKRDLFLSDNPHFKFVSSDDYNAARLAGLSADSIGFGECVRLACEFGMVEKSIQFQWPSSKLLCKARPDLYVNGHLIDVKTSKNAEERSFSNDVVKNNYHTRLAFYKVALEQMGHEVNRISFLVIENERPYLSCLYELDEFLIEQAELRAEKYMTKIFECFSNNKWPGYQDSKLTVPAWAVGIE